MKIEENFNREDWLNNLNVGDLVAYESPTRIGISKIVKITPTRRFNLKNGMTFKSNGESMESRFWRAVLIPVTNEIRERLDISLITFILTIIYQITKLYVLKNNQIEWSGFNAGSCKISLNRRL